MFTFFKKSNEKKDENDVGGGGTGTPGGSGVSGGSGGIVPPPALVIGGALTDQGTLRHSATSEIAIPTRITRERRATIGGDVPHPQSLLYPLTPTSNNIASLSPSMFASYKTQAEPQVPTGYIDEYYERDVEGNKYLEKMWMNVVMPATQNLARLELKYIVRRGIPDSKRTRVWKLISGYEDFKRSLDYEYVSGAITGEGAPKKFRNIPSFGGIVSPSDHFLNDQGIDHVKRILTVLALRCPEVEYCPSIPDILQMLLLFLSDVEAYTVLNLLIQQSKTNIKFRYLNITNRDCISFSLTFDTLFEMTVPKLYKHMIGLGITSSKVFTEEWFSRMFVSHLPFQTVLRVFDCFLCEGYKALYRVGLGLLKLHKNVLMSKATTAEQFCSMLKHLNLQMFDVDKLMNRAFRIRLQRNTVQNIDEMQTPKLTHIAEPQMPIYYRPKITTPSDILHNDDYEIVWTWLPHRFCICDPKVVYNSNRDGRSLRNMLERVKGEYPMLILIKTTNGDVFGCFTDDELESKFGFGSSNTFVFVMKPHAHVYRATNKNELYLKVCPSVDLSSFSMWIGASELGDRALCIDSELNGTTAPSDTYGNPALTDDQSFKFKSTVLEVISLV
ncbi:hypothetical protein SAMD00019534_111380 [Acytostelium subglobosum LB1]|uniref:hypothetical protein n=1 Tax=Acytostelium subglobosum LB1 TaxID=1410327 RepID=UPI000644E12D|nr:hypothetical protein SAMD00019534_111380 [Acytostelium subglobosum LB1]GAM27962.1 hypothetical protein SAMD00019534_111380 [Acytostelium subglobosum LB1]|eukprot:XP_012749245.1 hypothetical protein SAMD00019534_111380 [Acytostelium subglobosum LB1]